MLICGYLDIKSAGDPWPCFSIFFDGRWVRLSSVSVSRLGQRPTAKRPQGLDIETERRMLPVSEEDLCRCFQLMIIIGSVELGLAHGVPGCVGRPCLSGSSIARDRRQDGDWGDSTWVRSLILGRLSSLGPAATGLLGAGRGFIGWSGAATGPPAASSGGGRENLVAQVAQGVVAAASELAGHRQQRQLAV